MSKTKKSYWWLEKYNVDDSTYRESQSKNSNWWNSSYKSSTKGWMEKLGGYDWGYSWLDKKKNKKDIAYKRLLEQLQTSINVIDCDKDLKVKWSDGENINSPEEKCVYLSPDDLLEETTSGPVVKDDLLDILTGQVYLYKVLHGQISKQDFNKAKLNKDFKNTRAECVSKLWESLETNIAKKYMEDKWQGFMPHVIKEIDYNSDNKPIIQDFIDKSILNPSIDAIILGIAWNLVHEHNPVEIPDIYDECLEIAANILENPESEKKRFDACQRIVLEIDKILKSKNSKSSNATSSLSIKDFKVCNDQLFGKIVKNTIDAELSQLKTDSEIKVGGGSSVEYKNFDLSSLKNKFNIESLQEYDKAAYGDIVQSLKSVIQGIKNNFYSLNNRINIESYGHLSGDIDENNLYKLKLNDDRLMSKKDIISQKNIAICLLVDESGSMDDKYTEARNVAISLAEGLKDYFSVSIYGHTAEGRYANGCVINEYFTPRNKNIETCMHITSRNENVDGLAIDLVSKKFYQDYPDHRKILFHISDGEPSSSYYGGDEAIDHVNKVCQTVRLKLDIEIYGIGICDAFPASVGKSLYGRDNFVVLDDVFSSVGVIVRFLKQVCNKNLRVYS